MYEQFFKYEKDSEETNKLVITFPLFMYTVNPVIFMVFSFNYFFHESFASRLLKSMQACICNVTDIYQIAFVTHS